MRTDDFDYELPPERIALAPAEPRDAARLLVSAPDAPILDAWVRDLPGLLRPGDLLIANDTRVISAQLTGERAGRAGAPALPVSATLIEQTAPDVWRALAKPGRRLRVGDAVRFGDLGAEVCAKEEGAILLRFDLAGTDLAAAIERVGAPPLPPYISARRPPSARDAADYQTLFADRPGAVAAPTAGLHFTLELMAALAARGVETRFVTLHVGAGTFLPVKAERIADHRMHAEWREVSAETAEAVNAARAAGRRVIAVGTTALRSLESAVDETGRVRAASGATDIFITPGYVVRAVDGLWTNFHLPRSTLLMLVAALIGMERMRAVYAHAIAAEYRFYSFGDASLLWR